MTLNITTREGRPAVATLETGKLGPAAGLVLVIRDSQSRQVLLGCPVAHVTRTLVGSVVGDHAARIMALVAE